MKSVLVTGVGGGVGQSVIKALQATPYRIVAVDSEELAAGLHAVSSGYKGPYATDSTYVARLLQICRMEECALIFPGHDVELLPLAANAEIFRAHEIIPVVSSSDIIRICDDKLETNSFLRRHGFKVPQTCRLSDFNEPRFPVVLKPQRGGARSRQTYVVRNQKDFDLYLPLVNRENCIVQDYIDGEEYTCGTISFGGRCHGVIAMRRTLRAGDTYKAFVERNDRIESMVRDIVERLGPFGPCNIQLRLKDGEPQVFEINARCSGTTAARALAGFNEPKMVADFLLRGIEPTYSINEISVLRYWKELVIANERIDRLARTGHIDGDGTTL